MYFWITPLIRKHCPQPYKQIYEKNIFRNLQRKALYCKMTYIWIPTLMPFRLAHVHVCYDIVRPPVTTVTNCTRQAFNKIFTHHFSLTVNHSPVRDRSYVGTIRQEPQPRQPRALLPFSQEVLFWSEVMWPTPQAFSSSGIAVLYIERYLSRWSHDPTLWWQLMQRGISFLLQPYIHTFNILSITVPQKAKQAFISLYLGVA